MAKLSPEEQEYHEYLQWAQSQINAQRQKAMQSAQPQPFHPADNQDKQGMEAGQITQDPQSRAPQANKSAIRKAADIATAAATGIGQGAAMGMGRKLEPWEQEAQNEHPDATGYGRMAGSTLSSLLLGKGLGAAGGAVARGVGNVASKASSSPGLMDLIGLLSPRVEKGISLASRVASKAAPVAEAAESQAPQSLAQGLSQAPKQVFDPFIKAMTNKGLGK